MQFGKKVEEKGRRRKREGNGIGKEGERNYMSGVYMRWVWGEGKLEVRGKGWNGGGGLILRRESLMHANIIVTGFMCPSLRMVIVLEWEKGRMMVGLGSESGRSFPLRRPVEACSLMSGIAFIPKRVEHAEVGLSLQGGGALLIELDM